MNIHILILPRKGDALMRIRRKERRIPALFLTFLLITSIFLNAVSIIRAEESLTESAVLPEEVQDEPEEGSVPDDAGEDPDETEPVLERPDSPGDEPCAERTAQEGEAYPVYVFQPVVTFQDEVSGNVLNAGTAKQKEKNVAVGEVLSSWHRPVLSATCTWCMKNVVIFAPAVYGAVSASGSDPAVLGDPEYVSGVWTESSTMNGSGCLQLNCVTLRPGTAAVHVDYAARFDSYKDSGGPCPQCGKQVPPVYMNDVWYKYKNYYNVNVYVDYTLTYDANAGEDTVTGLPSPETRREYKDTAGIIVSDEEPEREGYNFLGWSKEAADKTSRYEAGDLITLEWKKGAEVGTTLYAVWEKVEQDTDPEDPLPDPPPKEPEDPLPDPPPEDPEDPLPDLPPEDPEDPLPDLPPEEPEDPLPDLPPGEPEDPSPGGHKDSSPDPPEEPPAVPDPPEAVPVPSVYEAPAPFDRKRPEVPELSAQTESGGTIPEENPIPRTEKRELRPDPRLRAADPKIPLAVHGHRCCILHFAVMLLALLTEAVYTGNMKKHQSRIFELRRKLARMQKL